MDVPGIPVKIQKSNGNPEQEVEEHNQLTRAYIKTNIFSNPRQFLGILELELGAYPGELAHNRKGR